MNTSTAFVRALLAYSVHEHQVGSTTHVDLVVDARSCVLALIALSSPLLTIEARRAARMSTQAYSWGIASGPVRSQATDGATGTRVTFTLPSEAPAIDEVDVLAQVDVWRAAHPNLRIDVRVVQGCTKADAI